MNFKPTLWKSIISIIGGIILGSYLENVYFDIIRKPTDIDIAIPIGTMILYFVVGIILIYLIWSFIQKKK